MIAGLIIGFVVGSTAGALFACWLFDLPTTERRNLEETKEVRHR